MRLTKKKENHRVKDNSKLLKSFIILRVIEYCRNTS